MSRATTSDSGETRALGRACTGAESRARAARLADARARCVPRVRIVGSGRAVVVAEQERERDRGDGRKLGRALGGRLYNCA